VFTILGLSYAGEGHFTFNLGVAVELVIRFNYTLALWSLDILDGNGNTMIAGLLMVPGVDLLKPYNSIKAQLGSLVVVEANPEDSGNPMMLGTNVQLLWFPVGTPVVLP
jgi:hypothetical protein